MYITVSIIYYCFICSLVLPYEIRAVIVIGFPDKIQRIIRLGVHLFSILHPGGGGEGGGRGRARIHFDDVKR